MADQTTNSPAMEGAGSTRTTADDLYKTLGHITAGIGLREQEHRQDRSQIISQQQTLLAKRKQAEASGDSDTFDELTYQLDRLDERLRVINHDLGEDPDASVREPEHDDGERDGNDERDGNAASDERRQQVEAQEPDRERRGVGQPDDLNG